MLRLKFQKLNAVIMRNDAIPEARERGEIINTQWRDLNGELYFKIPDEEVYLWLELLKDLSQDEPMFKPIVRDIEALLDDEKGFKKLGEGEADGNGAAGGPAGVAAGRSPGGGD